MGSNMYRQKPNIPALIGAVICLIGGLLMLATVQQNAEFVPSGSTMVPVVILLTFAATSTCLLIAFARYRFTHLWKNDGAVYSKKHKNKHGKHRRHHSHH